MAHHHGSLTIGKLTITILLNFGISLLELIIGFVFGSLALMSDALHNFSDGISLIISYIAIKLGERPTSPRHTFGLKRANILAAVINAVTLIIISFFLIKEAILRLFSPEPVSGVMMMFIAAMATIINIICTLILHADAKNNINIRSSYLHLLTDAVSSFAIVLGGIAIYLFRWYWLDPLLTLFISVYILFESWQIVREAIHIIMMGAPAGIDLQQIRQAIEALPEVIDIHHMHIWMLDDHHIHFEGHVTTHDIPISQTDAILRTITALLQEKFGIDHVTIQFECSTCLNSEH